MSTPNYAPDGYTSGKPSAITAPAAYTDDADGLAALIESKRGTWDAIDPDHIKRMRLQNRFLTGLDVAATPRRSCARTWPPMMPTPPSTPSRSAPGTASSPSSTSSPSRSISAPPSAATSISRAGWSRPCAPSSARCRTSRCMRRPRVPALISEIYTFLRQADAREIGNMFRAIDAARKAGDHVKASELRAQVENHETHVVPIIADIDAGSATRKRPICSRRR